MSGVERADEMTIACLHKRDVTLETRLVYDGVFTPISRIKKLMCVLSVKPSQIWINVLTFLQILIYIVHNFLRFIKKNDYGSSLRTWVQWEAS